MDGQPWRWKGVTAFKLCRLFTDGQDIDGFLSDYAGFNVLRVFDYTPVKDWGAAAWGSCTADQWTAFLAYVGAKGWFVELVLLTDDDPARIEPAKALAVALRGATNLILEAGNEPATHKNIDTAALRLILEASGFLHSSGNYEDTRHWYGTWLGYHSARDGEWPRRAHDALDYYQGGGPDFPEEPACKVPCVADEPAKLQDVTGNREQDFLAYFASASLLGAGGTFHSETGKTGLRPTPDELVLAAAALRGLNAFPADAPRGAYTRPDEGVATLRTYKVGAFTVRIRPADGVVLP